MKILALWRQWARALTLETYTLYYAFRNPRTPWYARLWGAIVVAYAFSSVDLIPDFIPVLGFIDDFVLIPLGVVIARKLIPRDILMESRQLAQDRVDSKKPVNWLAGGVVIAIWVALVSFVLLRVTRVFGK
jgi:uncharacterized membrane protein YkvA (DUF1232 family)